MVLQDDEERQGKERERVTPGKLRLTFEEQEKERQEQQRKLAEEEAKRRLKDERKAFEEAKLGMVHTSYSQPHQTQAFNIFDLLLRSLLITTPLHHTTLVLIISP